MAVPAGQLEAGRAYGMSSFQVFRRILLPQMVRHAIPGFGNNWLVLLKATALVSVIGLDDMVRKAALAAGATRLPFTFYMVVALGFLVFTTVSVLALRWAEERYSVGVRRE
jgi:arginine/ornithine transport system permease protein